MRLTAAGTAHFLVRLVHDCCCLPALGLNAGWQARPGSVGLDCCRRDHRTPSEVTRRFEHLRPSLVGSFFPVDRGPETSLEYIGPVRFQKNSAKSSPEGFSAIAAIYAVSAS